MANNSSSIPAVCVRPPDAATPSPVVTPSPTKLELPKKWGGSGELEFAWRRDEGFSEGSRYFEVAADDLQGAVWVGLGAVLQPPCPHIQEMDMQRGMAKQLAQRGGEVDKERLQEMFQGVGFATPRSQITPLFGSRLEPTTGRVGMLVELRCPGFGRMRFFKDGGRVGREIFLEGVGILHGSPVYPGTGSRNGPVAIRRSAPPLEVVLSLEANQWQALMRNGIPKKQEYVSLPDDDEHQRSEPPTARRPSKKRPAMVTQGVEVKPEVEGKKEKSTKEEKEEERRSRREMKSRKKQEDQQHQQLQKLLRQQTKDQLRLQKLERKAARAAERQRKEEEKEAKEMRKSERQRIREERAARRQSRVARILDASPSTASGGDEETDFNVETKKGKKVVLKSHMNNEEGKKIHKEVEQHEGRKKTKAANIKTKKGDKTGEKVRDKHHH